MMSGWGCCKMTAKRIFFAKGEFLRLYREAPKSYFSLLSGSIGAIVVGEIFDPPSRPAKQSLLRVRAGVSIKSHGGERRGGGGQERSGRRGAEAACAVLRACACCERSTHACACVTCRPRQQRLLEAGRRRAGSQPHGCSRTAHGACRRRGEAPRRRRSVGSARTR